MKERLHARLITVVDIGSSKIGCIMAESRGDVCRVLSVGHYATKGFSKGVITDAEVFEKSLSSAVHATEKMAGDTAQEVYCTFSAPYVESHYSVPQRLIRGGFVTALDVETLVDPWNDSQEHYHIGRFPLHYILDGQEGIRNPQGMQGRTLEACLHNLSLPRDPLNNITLSLQRCHLTLAGVLPTACTAGQGVLLQEEKDMGVAVMDIGHYTTSFGLFWGSQPIYGDIIPVGGHHITSDIAQGLETSLEQAERLKVLHGCALPSPQDQQTMIPVTLLAVSQEHCPSRISRDILINIIRDRLEDIAKILVKRLDRKPDYKAFFKGRLVLTGGGSQMPGIADFMKMALSSKQVRLAPPLSPQGLQIKPLPEFSALVGLLDYVHRDFNLTPSAIRSFTTKSSGGVLGRIRHWIKESL